MTESDGTDSASVVSIDWADAGIALIKEARKLATRKKTMVNESADCPNLGAATARELTTIVAPFPLLKVEEGYIRRSNERPQHDLCVLCQPDVRYETANGCHLYLNVESCRIVQARDRDRDLLIVDSLVENSTQRKDDREHIRDQSNHQTYCHECQDCANNANHEVHTGDPLS
jgi:hypothetical protein